MGARLQFTVRRHWFYLLLPVLGLAGLNARTALPWATQPRIGEAVTLLDWCLIVPLLYAICYRTMPRRALALRVLALACGGVWVAGQIVPVPAQSVLVQAGWLRSAGLVVLLLFEGAAIIAVLRLVYGAEPDLAELERQGVPPFIARLMLAEARFWRRVWQVLRGR